MASWIGRVAGIGAHAPALELPNADGEQRTLAHFKDRPLLVSFLGPAHCLFCRAHVIRLIQARDEIARLDASVILVTYHDPELLTAKMLHDLDVPYTLLLDPTRKTYERWGLGRVGLWGMVTPALYWASVGIMLKVLRKEEKSLGTSPGAPQRGGDFVLNCARKFMFANRMYSFHDRPKVEDLLAALRACAGENAGVRLSPQSAASR